MKWLIYGHKGWIGSMFLRHIELDTNDTIITTNSRCDNATDIENDIITHTPDRIICCIGRTHGEGCNSIDYLIGKLPINMRDNLVAPLIIAQLGNKYGIHVTYIGTGCIYNYPIDNVECGAFNTNVEFTEESPVNFFGSDYSIVKGQTDKLIRLYDNVLNARIRMPITNDLHSNRNFITKILGYQKVHDVPNSATYLPEMIPIILSFARNGITGTYNMVNPGVTSPKMVKDAFGMDYELVNESDLFKNGNVLEKRSNNKLNIDKLTNKLKELDLPYYISNINDVISHIKNPCKNILPNKLDELGSGIVGLNFK